MVVSSKVIRSCALAAAIAMVFTVLLCVFLPRIDEDVIGNYSVDVAKDAEATGAKTRILFTGTTFWGRRTNKKARASSDGINYPFAKLNTLHRENYQAWIGNLECPVTNKNHSEYEEEVPLIFNCHTDYLPKVAEYFTAFSLGTNHTDNWGDAGIETTKANLKEAGIQYFGSYKYNDGVNNCGIIALPVEVSFDDESVREYKIPFGLCSAHGVFGVPTEAALLNIKKYAEVLPTIVMPHMGVEYQSKADQLRTNLFRRMIDYGVDMVLADHPHWVQNTEAYKGKLIAYSMGNFMFDQQASETSRSAAIDVVANFSADMDFEAWNSIAELCVEKNGQCLDDITSAQLPKIEISWSNFDFVATTAANGMQTRLASDSERQSIKSRLNWETTLKGLKIKN